MMGRHTLHDYRYTRFRENAINDDAAALPIRYTPQQRGQYAATFWNSLHFHGQPELTDLLSCI